MAITQIDPTARDFETLRQRGREFLKNRVTSFRYGSFIQTDVVPAMIDVVAWFQEQTSFYYDRGRISQLLEFADTREDMVVLTRAQGYRMRPATSASVAVQATPTPAQPVPIVLRKGTRVPVGDLTFEVGEDATIPPGVPVWPDGSTSDLIVLVEGTTRTESFVSDGTKFQSFELGQPGTIEGSVGVTILDELWDEVASLVFIEGDRRGRDGFVGDGSDAQDYDLSLLNAVIDADDEDALIVHVIASGNTSADAVRWRQVETLTGAPREFTITQDAGGVSTIKFGAAANGSAPGNGDTIDVLYLISGKQKRYQLTYDTDDRATIRFGDGVFGVIPPNGATISVTYRTGGGVRGNVPAGTINTSLQGYLPNGAKTPVTISNLEDASGGEAPEDIEHARFFCPRAMKSNDRAVTKEDWTTIASTYFDKLYGAPAHCSAFLKQKVPELNTVCVAVWSRDQNGRLATAGSPLKLGIKNRLDGKRVICTSVEMKDGKIVFIDVEAAIVLEPGRVRQTVFTAVSDAITKFFASANVRPGVDVSVSKLYAAIQNVDGVSHAEVKRAVGGRRAVLKLATGDGVTNLFSGNFILDEGTTLLTKSLTATDGKQQVVDNGTGSFAGDVLASALPGAPGNVVLYSDGSFSVSFKKPPIIGASISAEARLGVFFAREDDLGGSNGTVTALDAATDYYPIIQRAPHGMWSGDQTRMIDGFRVGATNQFRGTLPSGITSASLTFRDSTGSPQVLTTNGAGAILSGVTPVGSVNFLAGTFSLEFPLAVTLPVRASWTTTRVDLFLPKAYLPLAPGRLFVWGGYSADGVQGPTTELIAYDDGDGNISGDVLPGGFVQYETGRVFFDWNTAPPPGAAGGNLYTATLTQAPDGIRKTFNFTVPADLSPSGLGKGVGRTRFEFSDLSRPGNTVEDAYDNWQGDIHGASIDREATNGISYSTGAGIVSFLTAPAASAPSTFKVQVTNVATFMYAGWVFRVKTPGGPGLDKGLFADNRGRLWGPPGGGSSGTFPNDRLDHLRGRYKAQLAGSAVAAGREMLLTYDALIAVPPALDIPIDGDQVAAVGRITLTEKPEEVFAQ
jgi:hypothetical protein